MKKVLSILVATMLTISLATAQEDEGTYIDNFGPKDSSYTETDLMEFSDSSETKKSNTGIYVGIAAIVVVGGIVFMLSKKKK